MGGGNSGGVEVGNAIGMFLGGGGGVLFHDLHGIDDEEKLDARRIDSLDDLDAPRGVVAHVIVMVDLAVQKLDADGDAVVFGDLFDAVEAGDGVPGALFIGHAGAVAGESDDVGDAGLGSQRNVLAKTFFNSGVVFDAVHGAANFTALRVTHAADQAVARGDFEFFGIQQVNALQADLGGVGAKLFERNFLIAPAGNRLADIALAVDRSHFRRPGHGWERSHSSSSENTLGHVAAGKHRHGTQRL